jgi:hypothetical protein
LERGVRRNGRLIVSAIQRHIDTSRTIAHQEHLSETCLKRLEKAARVVPKRQATIEFVSGYVREQVRQLDLAPPVSYARHSHLIPSCYVNLQEKKKTLPLSGTSHRLLYFPLCTEPSMRTSHQ